MALFIHTTGVLSKLLSEAVEAIEPGPVEGIRATGANKIEEILYGVLPQVMPLLISYSLYRFGSTSAPRRWSAWWAQAGLASPCGKRFAVSSSSKPAP